MHVIISTEGHLVRDGNGDVASDDGMLGFDFFQRYLRVFSSVTVVGRVADQVVPNAVSVEGPRVAVFPLCDYLGPGGYARVRRLLDSQIRDVCSRRAAYILRVPGNIGEQMRRHLRRLGQPFAVEVVGDPYEVCKPGAMKHWLRPVWRWLLPYQMARQCRQATGAAYVTADALQRRYPPGPNAFASHYSSVSMPPEAFVDRPRQFLPGRRRYRIVTVGTLAVPYKAVAVLIRAVARLVLRQGWQLQLNVVGDGKLRPELVSLAATCGVAEHVRFLGRLPAGAAIREQFDLADLFVLASFTEGVPRAGIEAMGRALPCIGSTVGGYPELLGSTELVEPGNAEILADRIQELLSDPARMTRLSGENLARARCYHQDVLQQRRDSFFGNVRDVTERRWRTGEHRRFPHEADRAHVGAQS